MLIDRDRFLRAALLMSLGGAPIAGGCVVVDDSQEPQPYQTTGGEEAQPAQVQQGPQPVMVRSGPSYEGGPVDEAGGPVYEGGGGPVYEGGPVNEMGAPVVE